MCVDLGTSVTVPDDLVFFRDGERALVVNPELGAWAVLDERALAVVRSLAAGQPQPAEPAAPPKLAKADASAAPPEPAASARRTVAELVMRRLVYPAGQRPELRPVDAPLKVLYYAITDGCNLRCPYCYAGSTRRLPDELTTEEAFGLVDEAAELGVEVIVFTGGEPLLRRDLFEVAERVRQRGMRANIITNATLVRTPELAARVAESFSEVTVSLDGGTPAAHERTRGVGTFATTVAALRMLCEHGARPTINHVVTRDNADRLADLGELLADIPVGAVRMVHQTQLGRGAEAGDQFGWPEYQQVHRFVWTSPMASVLLPDGPLGLQSCATKINCGMGGTEAYVDARGDVYPCKLVTGDDHRAGSIREAPLRDLLATPVLANLRANAVFCGAGLAECRRCYVRGACAGGCRAYHLARTGDIARNAGELCRILRHQLVTSMWVGAGADRRTILDNQEEAMRPLLVSTGQAHPADPYRRGGVQCVGP